jgi:hypothetical protein
MRRLNDTLMSTSQDSGPESHSPDDFECFAGKNENYNWKYLGERQMLGAINDPQSPPPTCPTDGGGSHCPANWEMRHMYILGGDRAAPAGWLATSIPSTSSTSTQRRTSECTRISTIARVNSLSTTLRGSSTRTACGLTRASLSILSSASFRPGPHRQTQSGPSTVCHHPGYDVPEKECWYINMGAVDRTFFNPDSVIRASMR